jgi:hypothetical protein
MYFHKSPHLLIGWSGAANQDGLMWVPLSWIFEYWIGLNNVHALAGNNRIAFRRARSGTLVSERTSLPKRLLLDLNHAYPNRPALPLREFQTRLLRCYFRLEWFR